MLRIRPNGVLPLLERSALTVLGGVFSLAVVNGLLPVGVSERGVRDDEFLSQLNPAVGVSSLKVAFNVSRSDEFGHVSIAALSVRTVQRKPLIGQRS